MKTNLITIVKTPDRDIVAPPEQNKVAIGICLAGAGILCVIGIILATLGISSPMSVVGSGRALAVGVIAFLSMGMVFCGAIEASLSDSKRDAAIQANKSVCIGSNWEISASDNGGYIATLLKGYAESATGELYPILSDIQLTLDKEQLQHILSISRDDEVNY